MTALALLMIHFRCFLLCSAILAPAVGLAQEGHFLSPSSFQLTSKSVQVAIHRGQGPTRLTQPWKGQKIKWLFVKTGLVQENRDEVLQWTDEHGNLTVPVPAAGPVMIGIDFEPVVEEVQVADLNLTQSRPVASLKTKCNVRHFRSAITLLRTSWPGDEAPDSTVATTETSLASSIHPLMDPTTFLLGGDMALETVVQGEEIRDAKIFARNNVTGLTTIMRTGGGGVCSFSPDSAGTYEFLFQYVRPVKNETGVDFEVFTTTLTFALTERRTVTS